MGHADHMSYCRFMLHVRYECGNPTSVDWKIANLTASSFLSLSACLLVEHLRGRGATRFRGRTIFLMKPSEVPIVRLAWGRLLVRCGLSFDIYAYCDIYSKDRPFLEIKLPKLRYCYPILAPTLPLLHSRASKSRLEDAYPYTCKRSIRRGIIFAIRDFPIESIALVIIDMALEDIFWRG